MLSMKTKACSICSVVVITIVSHTTGPQFDPGQMQMVGFFFKIVCTQN